MIADILVLADPILKLSEKACCLWEDDVTPFLSLRDSVLDQVCPFLECLSPSLSLHALVHAQVCVGMSVCVCV
jgi:hypothetical protein